MMRITKWYYMALFHSVRARLTAQHRQQNRPIHKQGTSSLHYFLHKHIAKI